MVEKSISKIALGSVQWGMAYGVANLTGQPGNAELARMLGAARAAGIGLIDTAFSYGRAETVIGELTEQADGFAIVTKTASIEATDDGKTAAARVASAFDTSRARLRRESVDALLVHNAAALLGPHGDRIWDALEGIKERSLAKKIGVSVYDPSQLRSALERYRIEIVQLPFNVYDRRFLESGVLASARAAGVEVHVRSAFLQGLLLMDADRLPPYFDAIRAHHRRFHEWCRGHGATPLRTALRFAVDGSGADKVVVGAESETQLAEIVQAMDGTSPGNLPEAFALEAAEIVNPSRWKL